MENNTVKKLLPGMDEVLGSGSSAAIFVFKDGRIMSTLKSSCPYTDANLFFNTLKPLTFCSHYL